MLELLTLIAVVVGTLMAYRKTHAFARRRLRYTRVGERAALSGLLVGAGTTVVAAPVAGLLPLVGFGSALLLGTGVGLAVGRGASLSRS